MRINIISDQTSSHQEELTQTLHAALGAYLPDAKLRRLHVDLVRLGASAEVNFHVDCLNPAWLPVGRSNVLICNRAAAYPEDLRSQCAAVWVRGTDVPWTTMPRVPKPNKKVWQALYIGNNLEFIQALMKAWLGAFPELKILTNHDLGLGGDDRVSPKAPKISQVSREITRREADELLADSYFVISNAADGFSINTQNALAYGGLVIGVDTTKSTADITEDIGSVVNLSYEDRRGLAEEACVTYKNNHARFLEVMKEKLEKLSATYGGDESWGPEPSDLPTDDLPMAHLRTELKSPYNLQVLKYCYLMMNYPRHKMQWTITDATGQHDMCKDILSDLLQDPSESVVMVTDATEDPSAGVLVDFHESVFYIQNHVMYAVQMMHRLRADAMGTSVALHHDPLQDTWGIYGEKPGYRVFEGTGVRKLGVVDETKPVTHLENPNIVRLVAASSGVNGLRKRDPTLMESMWNPQVAELLREVYTIHTVRASGAMEDPSIRA